MSDRKKVLVGFDGSIDRTVKPIKISGKPNQFFSTIEEFGNYLASKAGLSCSIQTQVIKSYAGGNGVFVAKCLKRHGCEVYLAGLFGEETPAPEFLPLVEDGIKLFSIGNNQVTECYEFDDGKIMISPVCSDQTEPFSKLCRSMGRSISLFHEADLIAMLNWGELPWMQKLWDDASVYMSSGIKAEKDKFIFFDTADISCRSSAEIEAMLNTLRKFCLTRYSVLSLNENEALCIGKAAFKGECDTRKILSSLVTGGYTDEAVIHSLHCTEAFDGKEYVLEKTDYVEKPLVSTGAGDNFNGGYCAALLCGCNLAERVNAANRSSHHYLITGTVAGANIFL